MQKFGHVFINNCWFFPHQFILSVLLIYISGMKKRNEYRLGGSGFVYFVSLSRDRISFSNNQHCGKVFNN